MKNSDEKQKLKIGLVVPAVYTEKKYFPKKIFAPYEIAISLANGLVGEGHIVNFYGAPTTKTEANLIPLDLSILEKALLETSLKPFEYIKQFPKDFTSLRHYVEMQTLERAYTDLREGEIDLVHAFHGFMSLFLAPLVASEKSVITFHDPILDNNYYFNKWIFERHKKEHYISISKSQQELLPDLNYLTHVYNGVDTDLFEYSPKEDGYFAFMGRIVPQKGVTNAIAVAKETGVKLKIAGNTQGGWVSKDYFETQVKPGIDNQQIFYENFLEGKKRVEFLQKAKALLFPIEWEEPFGMVMIEAMSCGTPVIAFNRGSVPEIIKDQVTGFIVSNQEEMAAAILKIDQIDRKACREHVEKKFSARKMVKNYEKAYLKLLNK